MSIMAFIPARGGSKGIPRKNLALLAGKPLIQYTIEAAQGSKYIDEIFISSEDDEIISFCKSLGVDVQYKRPSGLASDEASMIDTVLDAMEWKKKCGLTCTDNIMLLQSTSPLRNSDHIDAAVMQYLETGAESLVSVHEMVEHPYECVRLISDGWSYLASPPSHSHRRQDYGATFYYINGAIYLARTDFLIREKTFVRESKTSLFFMRPQEGVDIDDAFHLKLAESLLASSHSVFSNT
jgi:CMP-N-acetylneuraminic acid synthetase